MTFYAQSCLTSLLIVMFAASVLAQVPPLPPGEESSEFSRVPSSELSAAALASVPAPATNGLFRIRVVKYTPQISRIEFYCVTNRPLRWQLEGSADLVNWRFIEGYTGTNDFAPRVPMLRDNAQLITHLLVAPQTERMFYRLKPLP